MERFARYFEKYTPRVLSGDPKALGILAFVGICVAGAYVVKKVEEKVK